MGEDSKIRLAILFGGKSAEHDISICTALRVYKSLDLDKFRVTFVAIDKNGIWRLPNNIELNSMFEMLKVVNTFDDPIFTDLSKIEKQIQMHYLCRENFDVVFPLIHGTYGEDGCLQGFFEVANLPYVGSGVLGSAIGLDKEIFKRVLRDQGIPIVPFIVVRKDEFTFRKEKILEQAADQFTYPYFIKPSSLGSSIGVSKIFEKAEAYEKFNSAFKYGNKVLVERYIKGQELECTLARNTDQLSSHIFEMLPHFEFLTFDAKYVNKRLGMTIFSVEEDLPAPIAKRIRELASQVYRALDCAGLVRVDFFLERETQALYVNEVNTIPAYGPHVWEAKGFTYSEILNRVIDEAFERHNIRI